METAAFEHARVGDERPSPELIGRGVTAAGAPALGRGVRWTAGCPRVELVTVHRRDLVVKRVLLLATGDTIAH
ncbi:hypothetical protein AB0M44_12190 [Streptosporangium subroseum]|uniref:hypothetical protein n=1 Tax=Streptosporangium subroseum TaxID=106412 RepID=UPI003437613A